MKVNYKTFFCVLLVIELYYVELIDGKRSFGITGRRNKSKSPSVRRGQHGHEGDDHIPVPKPQTPERKKDIGWNTNSQHSTNTHTGSQTHGLSSPPLGPQMPQTNRGLYGGQNAAPPAYSSHAGYGNTGYGHGQHSSYGAPPAYGSYGAPPSYGASMGYNHHNSYGHQPGMYGGGMMGSPFMGGSVPMMGAPVMGVMPAYQNRGSSFGSGIMTNLFAGLAGYQLAKAFSGGSGHRDREIIIYDNRQVQANNDGSTTSQQQASINQQTPLGPISSVQSTNHQGTSTSHDLPQNPASSFQTQSSTEIPQTPVLPASNEYNYWGLPQYGIPLYGYNLPSQITDYYKVETFRPQ